MFRRIIAISVVVTVSLVLILLIGTPKTTKAAADATNLSIDTTPFWNGTTFISSFGMPDTATYGQTISATRSATLMQFSFMMEVTRTTIFRGYVFIWDGYKASGTPLFESAPMSTSVGKNFEEVTFNIPCGIVLQAGQQYVLFASTSKDPAQPNSAGKWGSINDNSVYSGGQFVYLNNGADPSLWTTTDWSTITQDLAFKAKIVNFATIDTTPDWDRKQFISSFGQPNTATYGQTISMNETADLGQFSFMMQVTTTAIFRGYVFGWDGSKAIGSPLFESAPMSTLQGKQFEEVVFNVPPGVRLDKGQQYVIFASTSNDAQPNTAGRWGAVITNTVYGGGQFVFINNGSDTSKWTTASWSTIPWDLAFKVQYNRLIFLPVVRRE